MPQTGNVPAVFVGLEALFLSLKTYKQDSPAQMLLPS